MFKARFLQKVNQGKNAYDIPQVLIENGNWNTPEVQGNNFNVWGPPPLLIKHILNVQLTHTSLAEVKMSQDSSQHLVLMAYHSCVRLCENTSVTQIKCPVQKYLTWGQFTPSESGNFLWCLSFILWSLSFLLGVNRPLIALIQNDTDCHHEGAVAKLQITKCAILVCSSVQTSVTVCNLKELTSTWPSRRVN